MVEKTNLTNGEHVLIPVTAKMIHSTVYACKWFVWIDSCPLHMVMLVGAVRYHLDITMNVMIDVEYSTELVRVFVWHKINECMSARVLIHECNGNVYFCVIGKVTDYYGVHEIMAFDVWPIISCYEVTYQFLEVAYSFEKTM
jgi:hypothetical protein